ncbi:TPA: hypothetical protein U2D04_000218 [Streptococcus suis]|nr:hypothetical protein [Streptococcus suis]HEM6346346.1 hypothetical protein [Streptococcus suis]
MDRNNKIAKLKITDENARIDFASNFFKEISFINNKIIVTIGIKLVKKPGIYTEKKLSDNNLYEKYMVIAKYRILFIKDF